MATSRTATGEDSLNKLPAVRVESGKRQIATREDVRRLGTILGVWAHPDDESFLAGGLLATAVRNGQRVACITFTRGEAGSRDEKRWPPETLGQVRTAEMEAALKILGIREHYWENYPDGGCAKMPDPGAVNVLRGLIERIKPDSIVTFGPDGLTGHSDHQSVSRWAEMAVQASVVPVRIFHAVCTPEQYNGHLKAADARLNIFFNIKEPPLVPVEKCIIAYLLPEDILTVKRKAFLVMPSQMEALHEVLPLEKFNAAFAGEYFVELAG